MSKNKGGGDFQNRAARLFRTPDRVDLIDQSEIFETLDKDIELMLDQLTKHRNREPGAKYPTYISNGFANISTALWFKNYVEDHVKLKKKRGKIKLKSDLSEDQLESLRQILVEAYKKSCQNVYAQQTQDFIDRNRLLARAFVMLDPKNFVRTKKLGLKASQRRDLCIQVYGDPVHNMKFIYKIIDDSTLSEKKKMKLLKKMYGKKRFVDACGAAMTVDKNGSDCLAMLIEYVLSIKKDRKRAPYILAYARAYKLGRAGTCNFRLRDGNFYKKNKPIIKELIKYVDRGFKKAFKQLKPSKAEKTKVKKEKEAKKPKASARMDK